MGSVFRMFGMWRAAACSFCHWLVLSGHEGVFAAVEPALEPDESAVGVCSMSVAAIHKPLME